MKSSIRILVVLSALSLTASAGELLWTLNGVTFDDGGTATGSFVFDADAGVPCSTAASPCGMFSSINITTTTGSSRTGATYLFFCGVGGVTNCDGLSPDSSEILFLSSNAADQTGVPGFALYFTAVSGPPMGLTDAGGTIDVSNSIAGAGFEADCSDATCSAGVPPIRATVAGTVSATATPEPSSALLLAAALTGLNLVRVRKSYLSPRMAVRTRHGRNAAGRDRVPLSARVRNTGVESEMP